MGNNKRVLIYRLGSLGDTVVALPSFHLIARAFPEAERRLVTNFPVNAKAAPAAGILANTGLVHGYFRYEIRTRSPLKLLALWWEVMQWRPQTLVYMGVGRGVELARRDARFFRLCGVKRLVGIPVTAEAHLSLIEKDGTLEPEAARLGRGLAELGTVNLDDPASWDLHLTADEHARAGEALVPVGGRPIIAVSVGTKVQAKDWGRENWRALLAEVARMCPGYALTLSGSPEESEASEFAAGGWRGVGGGPVVNLCGVLSPRESAALFARARIFVGHDSGPMHLAAAVGTPCVAIFAARNKPRVWFPYGQQHRVIYHKTDCWGCGLETCVVEKKKCILSITVDEVLAQVEDVLNAVPLARPSR